MVLNLLITRYRFHIWRLLTYTFYSWLKYRKIEWNLYNVCQSIVYKTFFQFFWLLLKWNNTVKKVTATKILKFFEKYLHTIFFHFYGSIALFSFDHLAKSYRPNDDMICWCINCISIWWSISKVLKSNRRTDVWLTDYYYYNSIVPGHTNGQSIEGGNFSI